MREAASKWLARMLRPPRKLRFTRLGRWYCGLTIAVGLAAINTGNNLLFLVLGLLLSNIIVSGVLSEQALRRVTVGRRLPSTARAGVEALVGLWARNGKRRAPSFSLELREAGGDVQGRAFLLALLAGEEKEAAYRTTPLRRGVHRFASLEVATRSPFGLFEKSLEVEAPAELIVFPRRVPAPPSVRESSGNIGERPSGRAGAGIELHALRDHREGGDVRMIHWRSSARAGRLIAIEREHARRRSVCIALDHRLLSGADLEAAVERAAALVERELGSGAEVSLALCGQTLPLGTGPGQLQAALTALALVQGAPGAPAPLPPPSVSVLHVGGLEAA